MKISDLLNTKDSESISLGIRLLSQTDFLEWIILNKHYHVSYDLSRIFYGNDWIYNMKQAMIVFEDSYQSIRSIYHFFSVKYLSELCQKYEDFRNAQFFRYRNCDIRIIVNR